MTIKKYQAKTFGEALACVKRELGEEAVIISSEDRKGARPYVEITAAVDYDIEQHESKGYVPATSPVQSSDLAELKNEIKTLRECVEAMRNSGGELTLPAERKKMFYFLRERSIRDDYALNLVERARDIEDLETLISEDMCRSKFFDSASSVTWNLSSRYDKRIVMLIGPTGAGKTTTVAKLASKAVKEGRRAAIIGVDTFKIGAAEQIRIYSKMIGIPLEIVADAQDLKKSVRKYNDRDILLIDTTGQNPKDDGYIRGLKDIYKTGLSIETQLLLSTSSDCDFLINTYKHYGALPIDYMAFTKTDEAVNLGSIYNLCRTYRKPVAYITTGQRVPGNIEFVDSRKLTNLILKTGSA
ncbi:MAG: flagellar biosynthesis protein FlhF [Nitrospirae bacterium]|nr:flagellar biosynthesis protein FlhF [Nitrospirota bacterium]